MNTWTCPACDGEFEKDITWDDVGGMFPCPLCKANIFVNAEEIWTGDDEIVFFELEADDYD